MYFPMFPSFPPLPCLSPASNLHPFMDSATVALLCAEHWAGHRIQGTAPISCLRGPCSPVGEDKYVVRYIQRDRDRVVDPSTSVSWAGAGRWILG